MPFEIPRKRKTFAKKRKKGANCLGIGKGKKQTRNRAVTWQENRDAGRGHALLEKGLGESQSHPVEGERKKGQENRGVFRNSEK